MLPNEPPAATPTNMTCRNGMRLLDRLALASHRRKEAAPEQQVMTADMRSRQETICGTYARFSAKLSKPPEATRDTSATEQVSAEVYSD